MIATQGNVTRNKQTKKRLHLDSPALVFFARDCEKNWSKMTNHFNEDLKRFFAQNRQDVNPAVARAAMHYDDALKAVCADGDHLAHVAPRMLRTCCPPMRRIPSNASKELKEAVERQTDHCYRAKAGWGYDRNRSEAYRQRMRHEINKQQKIVDDVTQEACKNPQFAKKHNDVCCVSTSINLGFPEDSQLVAKACKLAEL